MIESTHFELGRAGVELQGFASDAYDVEGGVVDDVEGAFLGWGFLVVEYDLEWDPSSPDGEGVEISLDGVLVPSDASKTSKRKFEREKGKERLVRITTY